MPGVDGFLPKPVNFAELQGVIREVWASRALASEARD